MASMSAHHQELTDGEGKCSVPMWQNGCPAGFCDKPAYGVRPPGKQWRNAHSGEMMREDGRYNGYVPGLACLGHGGPEKREAPSAAAAPIVTERLRHATELPMAECGLKINVGADGTWLHFTASTGLSASLNVETMTERGGIIGKALADWAADRRKQARQPMSYAPANAGTFAQGESEPKANEATSDRTTP